MTLALPPFAPRFRHAPPTRALAHVRPVDGSLIDFAGAAASYSRSSIGTAIDRNGVRYDAGLEQPRFECDTINGRMGLLIEAATENIVTNPLTATGGGWTAGARSITAVSTGLHGVAVDLPTSVSTTQDITISSDKYHIRVTWSAAGVPSVAIISAEGTLGRSPRQMANGKWRIFGNSLSLTATSSYTLTVPTTATCIQVERGPCSSFVNGSRSADALQFSVQSRIVPGASNPAYVSFLLDYTEIGTAEAGVAGSSIYLLNVGQDDATEPHFNVANFSGKVRPTLFANGGTSSPAPSPIPAYGDRVRSRAVIEHDPLNARSRVLVSGTTINSAAEVTDGPGNYQTTNGLYSAPTVLTLYGRMLLHEFLILPGNHSLMEMAAV